MKKNTLKILVKTQLIIALIFSLGFTNTITASCTINGPSSITQGQTATYTSSTSAQAYYWSTSGSLSIIGSSTGSSVQIQCNGSGGSVKLTTFSGGVCTTCTDKVVTCGIVDCSSHDTSFGMSTHHTGLHFTFEINTFFSGDLSYSSVSWTTSSSLHITATGTPVAGYFTGAPSMPRFESITALFTYPDGCTRSVTRSIYFELFGDGGFGFSAPAGKSNFTIYPNPANTELTIKNKEKSLLGVIEIRDISNGRLVKTTAVNSKNQDIGIDVKTLKQGHYILTIFDKKGNVIFKDRLLISN